MAINLDTDIKLLDPAGNSFDVVDFGQNSVGLLLLNILMELRVHTQYLQTMNMGIVSDDPIQMRLDQVNDPSSLNIFTPTSNF